MPKDPCSELSRTITDLAMMIGEDSAFDTIDKVTTELQRHIPEITRDVVVDSIVEASSTHREALQEARSVAAALKSEARQDSALRKLIAELEGHLEAGTLPESAPRTPKTATGTIQTLRDIRDRLRAEVRGSTPAVRERLQKSIDRLTEKLDAVQNVPPAEPKGLPQDAELARLEFQKRKLQQEIRRKINSMRPPTFWGVASEAVNLPRSMMASLDFSAVLRQGAFVALGHPIRASKSLGPMFRSFKSEQTAQEIYDGIMERPNAPLYDRAGLYLAPLDGSLGKKEEAFMSRIADRVPGVAGSQRAYITFLNLLRADSFDAAAETWGVTPGQLTMQEAQHAASFINTATGRGSLGKAEPAGTVLATVFFSPRLVASRFQLLTGQPLWGGTIQTRKAIATEYGRFLAGVGLLYVLGSLGGGEIEKDPRSSDFGKIRFGNTRIDPLAGLAQTTTLVSRLVSGSRKTAGGEIVPIRGDDVPYGGGTSADVIARFLRAKLSPAFGSAVNLVSGENVVGEPVTVGSELRNAVTPLAYRDIYEAMKEHGIPEGFAIGILSMFGMGVQTYGDQGGSLPPDAYGF